MMGDVVDMASHRKARWLRSQYGSAAINNARFHAEMCEQVGEADAAEKWSRVADIIEKTASHRR